ncbi:MAG TPA: HAD-IA family hydrolase [Acidobacteriota bacterium]|nr:HAD-IA family hydrolase [Acidobacteriota bacterium]
MIETVFFDAAGTLIELRMGVGEAYAGQADSMGWKLDDAVAIEQRFRESFSQAEPMTFPDARPHEIEDLEREWWRQRVRAALGKSAQDSRFNPFFDTIYRWFATSQAWRPAEDAHEVLKQLSLRGIRRAVVSNFDSRLEAILRELDLHRHLDEVIWSSREGAAKPDPRLFEIALRRTCSQPARTLHVGDRPQDDYRGAVEAGLQALLLDPYGKYASRGMKTIRRLNDLIAVVERHNRASHE